jgi:vWA domain found in the FtsH ternary systems/N-terminal helical region fused to the FtsH ternary system vWA domain
MTASVHELRDAEEASRILGQSFLLQRLHPPTAGALAGVLEWALDSVGAGVPIPPLGVLADLGNLLLKPHESSVRNTTQIAGWSDRLALAYEDLVLGKWLADSSLERAGDALRGFSGRDRARGLAFVSATLAGRCGFGVFLLSPAILKKLRDQPADRVLAAAWESLNEHGLSPLLPIAYHDLEQRVRRAPSMLGSEDVFELEHRTVLADFSQRVALRQVLQATAALREALAEAPPVVVRSAREVPSHLRDEDAYPVGGFTSLSNRGTVESLLHSQLAFMEDDRPDLFDIKFLRDELLYYSRDENQFFRRRRTFVLAFFPDLVQSRVKDPASPWQRVIFLLGLVVALLDRLADRLGDDALSFELLFVHGDDGTTPLLSERGLLETIFRTQIADGKLTIADVREAKITTRCEEHARRSLVDSLLLATAPKACRIERVPVGVLRPGDAGPTLEWIDAVPTERPRDDGSALERWAGLLEEIANRWIGR